MKNNILKILFTMLIVYSCSYSFHPKKFENRFMEGWNTKNIELIDQYYSELYNEYGMSKEDAIGMVKSEFFEKYDKLNCKYQILSFELIPHSKVGFIKAALELRGIKKGEKNEKKIFKVYGYANLILEDGAWRVYGTQLPYFYSVVPNFEINKEKDNNWPHFVSKNDSISKLAEEYKGLERLFVEKSNNEAWNNKDLRSISNQYSNLFIDRGCNFDKLNMFIDKNIFKNYSKIKCEYKLLTFKRLTNKKLGSLKIAMEVKGALNESDSLKTIFQFMGYQSMILENNKWKIYEMQPAYAPPVPDFSFDKVDTSFWPEWGKSNFFKK